MYLHAERYVQVASPVGEVQLNLYCKTWTLSIKTGLHEHEYLGYN
jgi:hypothetical protein